MKFPITNRDKIDYGKPTCTFDVNLVALKSPESLSSLVVPVYKLEFNYFQFQNVELCVTPETEHEITQGVTVASLGPTAYRRLQKTKLFKSRPPGATLTLSDYEASKLYTDLRNVLWPTVEDRHLTPAQLSDVTQAFYYTASSGGLLDSAFVTNDQNFHRQSGELKAAFGINIMAPDRAWQSYLQDYSLYDPNQKEIDHFWREQDIYFNRLREEAEEC